jgi:hypothetical protein
MCRPLEREVAAEEPMRFAARVEPEREGWWAWSGVFGVGVEGFGCGDVWLCSCLSGQA